MHFNRFASRLTAAILLAGAMITPSLAADGTVTTPEGSPLRLRSEASIESTVLKKLANGSVVEVLSSLDGGWYQVTYDGTTGYVSAEYLTVNDDEDVPDEEDSEAPEAPAPQAKSGTESDGKNYVRVVEGPLNIRSGPGTDYEKAGKLYTGRVVEVLDLANGWYKLENGYISADYVVEASASEAQSSGKAQELVDYALQFIGTPYVYGGSSPRGFDCSGFTSYVYKQCGVKINRTASAQLNNGYAVSRSDLQPGDLVMFKSGGSKPASHVGIYIGNGQFVHSSAPGVGVVIDSLNSNFYSRTYVGARRVVS
ncbi:MAG: SH3 domain-containing protein [Lawsonibacter sp.]|nr:SH3 domain-containing protein [Lawsonibacter sp.]